MIHSVLDNGYFIEVVESSDLSLTNVDIFCGQHSINGGICPNCNKPLLRLLSLNVSTILPSCPMDVLHFLFCWTCEIAQGVFSYKFTTNAIEVLEYKVGQIVLDFPYDNYPIFFPEKRVQLIKIPRQFQKIICDVNSSTLDFWLASKYVPQLVEPCHQFGGEPYLVNIPMSLICPICGIDMPFILSISDNSGTREGFTGNEYVQMIFHICVNCCIISVYQICD
jgi:hypothetical protein